MIAFWWACCTPWQTSRNSSRRARILSFRRSQYVVIGSPSTYSITKYGCPSSVAPASNTLAIAGWFITASDCRSARNRCSTASS
jgi:hypothetical protein